MKLNRTYLFIGISSLALIIVLVIQVNWIYEMANRKEELFNEKAGMVLAKTAEALASDTATVKKLEVCVGQNETHKIDSLLAHYMTLYKVQIAYYFEVKPGAVPVKEEPPVVKDSLAKKEKAFLFTPYTSQPGCYQACVTDGKGKPGDGLELKLVFPDKEEFILAEMGLPFITSVLLILVVLVMSWRTTMSLMKEKEISEHTTDFLNNMTHEFKTPLTNIALAGKMMTRETNIKQEEKIKHYSGIILEENEKLKQQVEQVLSMTALERGEIPLSKTELDVHVLICDCIKCISVQIENRQGNLELNLEAEHFVISGDKTHLTNAICNLIDNAIKYSDGAPQIEITTSNVGTNLQVLVTDKGIGIPENYHNKVFDKFFRVPTGNVHDVKGFGLGLTYIKKIVEMHGGTIELQSEAGEGTSFIILIPYV